jgi:diguanylate cyclase (GGDEF)-like protein/PAS domain S-box-containing protein
MAPIFPQVAARAPDLRGVLTVRRHAVTVVIIIATVTFAACMATGPGGYASGVSTIGTALMAAVAGVACLVRAGRCTGRTRWAWRSIGLGMLCYAVGDVRWTWVETVHGEAVPFPSLADAGYLAMPPLVVAGLLMVPVARQSVANRIRSVVDGLMIATSLLLVSWLLVIGPLLAQGAETSVALPVVLAYPVSDIVLVTVVCYMLALLRRGGRNAGQLVLIAAAAALIGLSDTVYAYGMLGATYASGSVLDTGWFAGFALITLAAHRPDRVVRRHREDVDEQEPFAIVLPYAVVVGALLISVARHGEDNTFANWCRSVLILLIVARQLLTLLENRRLTRTLESRVAARTADLYASEQRFRALVQQSSDSVAVIDADSTIRYQSESVERIFGWPAAVLLGHRLTAVAGRRAGPRIAAAIESVLGEPYATTVVELQLRHRDGRLRQAEMTITNLLDDPSVAGLVLNTRDIQDAKELQDQLVHEAYHDGLTGLASRTLFRERLQAALEVSERDDVAVLFLDLDGFKEVNDSLGHAAGDQLLVQVADRLRESVRDGDTVARFGGDEFAVLVESVTALADAETVARRIIDAVGRPFPIGRRELHVGASVGIASAADAGDIEQLMRNADLAMYRAKADGGSGLASYDPQMHDQLMDRLELEADLRAALDRGELAVHYQPTVALRTGEIVGFEALVRWYHPTRGVVSPLDFIGIAEATGLIVPLGRWVLAEACRQAVSWGAGAGRALKMAVNVSVRQFDHGDLAATVAEVLAETGMPADRLCLEMTESVLLSDTDENLTRLLRLRALGVTLAMDDFGTGYSSLAYLQRFPLDVLKIDRSFVDRLGGDREDVALVHTIVRLGKSLGMATVAEGIEDPEQLAALREMDCDFVQGYYLLRPLPAGEAGRVLGSGLPVAAGTVRTAG